MELITGTAKTPHVTSTQHRSIYEMIIGEGSYILGKGELLEPELQSNNVLRIRSGMLCHHGSISEVKQNTYDEVNIGNGSQGMKRIDLVVARYTKNPETEIETMTWEVIQGTPAADSPVAPAYTEGNMQDGDLTDDCPLFEVHLDGIQVTEVVKLLGVLNGSLAELNSNIETGADLNGNRYVRFKKEKLQICYGTFQATVALSQNGSGFTGVSSSIKNGVFPKPFSALDSLVIQKNAGDWATILGKSASSTEITQVILGYWGGYTSRSFAFDYVAIGTYTD